MSRTFFSVGIKTSEIFGNLMKFRDIKFFEILIILKRYSRGNKILPFFRTASSIQLNYFKISNN